MGLLPSQYTAILQNIYDDKSDIISSLVTTRFVNMNTNGQWVALLTEDEEDYIYWQHGFNIWASQLHLEWFATGDAFLVYPKLIQLQPAVLLLDGLLPRSEELAWLKRILSHEYCQGMSVIMLAGQFSDEERQMYLDTGAAECMLKPTSYEELEQAVARVGSYPH
jgi:DNA-binding response OmpR family regulator